jgi:AraC family transcriptional regulator
MNGHIPKPTNQTIIDHRYRVQKAMSFIEQNLGQICSIERLAQEACLSIYHFNRVFAACSGETPIQYWIRNRMIHAARRLLSSNQRVLDVAFEIGYESHNAFSKAFKKWYGVSPRAFRDNPFEIDSWGYAFDKYSANRPTYSLASPFVCSKSPMQFVYMEAGGLIEGSFVEVGMSIMEQIKSALLVLNLTKFICGFVSVFPTRPSGFVDPNARIQIGAIITKPVQHIEPIRTRIIEAGRWVIFRHTGPLELLYQTWNAAYFNWLPSNGLRPRAGAPFEWYKDLFTATPINQHQTLIHIPIH